MTPGGVAPASALRARRRCACVELKLVLSRAGRSGEGRVAVLRDVGRCSPVEKYELTREPGTSPRPARSLPRSRSCFVTSPFDVEDRDERRLLAGAERLQRPLVRLVRGVARDRELLEPALRDLHRGEGAEEREPDPGYDDELPSTEDEVSETPQHALARVSTLDRATQTGEHRRQSRRGTAVASTTRIATRAETAEVGRAPCVTTARGPRRRRRRGAARARRAAPAGPPRGRPRAPRRSRSSDATTRGGHREEEEIEARAGGRPAPSARATRTTGPSGRRRRSIRRSFRGPDVALLRYDSRVWLEPLTWLGHAASGSTRRAASGSTSTPGSATRSAPTSEQEPERVDVIALTHGHGDHVGETVALSRSFELRRSSRSSSSRGWLAEQGVEATTAHGAEQGRHGRGRRRQVHAHERVPLARARTTAPTSASRPGS